MINRIRVVTLLVMVLGVFALLQLISGSLFFSSLHHSQKSFVVSNQLREQQGELTSTWDLMLQTRINLSRSAVRMMMDSSNQQSNAKVELLDSARKTLAQAATHYKKFKSMAPLPEMVATSRNIDEKYKNYYTAVSYTHLTLPTIGGRRVELGGGRYIKKKKKTKEKQRKDEGNKKIKRTKKKRRKMKRKEIGKKTRRT
uniref:Tar ligand binding domain-containing protein n=1 Tax=Escherichia coli TaxID=562 RepID=UPI00201A35FC